MVVQGNQVNPRPCRGSSLPRSSCCSLALLCAETAETRCNSACPWPCRPLQCAFVFFRRLLLYHRSLAQIISVVFSVPFRRCEFLISCILLGGAWNFQAGPDLHNLFVEKDVWGPETSSASAFVRFGVSCEFSDMRDSQLNVEHSILNLRQPDTRRYQEKTPQAVSEAAAAS